ncbi:hypothetical protein Y032_0004g1744 [Ancylostoma ceylanicum]|uniref:Uncharacterized protein n=1 Tax=Ancylostoma ceylanicum TaxID=53326 RepID=A0A016VTJ8_9BILA|nr:hypothetical protein Y032_0004g1744 [Ancylostoma ceylanicum]
MEANGESEDETCGDDHLGVRRAACERCPARPQCDVVTFAVHQHAWQRAGESLLNIAPLSPSRKRLQRPIFAFEPGH